MKKNLHGELFNEIERFIRGAIDKVERKLTGSTEDV
jgi:hypothetical protein